MSKTKKSMHLSLIIVFLLIWNATGCVPGAYNRLKREVRAVTELGLLDKDSPYLKVHLLDGRVYILSSWSTNEQNGAVSGNGDLLDINRNLIKTGNFTVPLEEVALFETNVVGSSHQIQAMTILSVPSALISILCLSNPKACFGSCPTFYAWDGEKMQLQAEGFSSSVTRALEARDIDALYRAKPAGPNFELRVTNEAMETHVIRSAKVMVAPRPKNGRIFATTSQEFWQATEMIQPSRCTAAEGDCLEKVRAYDGIERFSKADSTDLATREILELEFDTLPPGKLGLILSFRQTLLTTFLFYQGLAYMGRASGYWISRLERADQEVRGYSQSVGEVLGGIEVLVENNKGKWIKAGEIKETGPIASDTKVVLLPEIKSSPLKVRLRLACGLWRLDYLSLAELVRRVEPIRIEPSLILNGDSVDEEAKRRLLDPSEVLVTMPGDAYTLIFDLPSDFQDYELFLESQGYYLEWMRENWLAEESFAKTVTMFTNPQRFLKEIAPEFKKAEPQMEEAFWRSKYAKK